MISTDVNNKAKTWLQLYVDAMTERDPYKRLALVQELRTMPRHDDSEEGRDEPIRVSVKRTKSMKKSKLQRRH